MNRLRVSPLNLRPPIRFNPWFRQMVHGAPLEHKAQTYRLSIDITLLWSEKQSSSSPDGLGDPLPRFPAFPLSASTHVAPLGLKADAPTCRPAINISPLWG